MGQQARAAARRLAAATTGDKNNALLAMAAQLQAQTDAILAANARDVARAKENGMSQSMLDRLSLSKDRIDGTACAKWRRCPTPSAK